jgi:hypothetical protein
MGGADSSLTVMSEPERSLSISTPSQLLVQSLVRFFEQH